MLRTILIVCVFTSTITSNTLYNNNPFLANVFPIGSSQHNHQLPNVGSGILNLNGIGDMLIRPGVQQPINNLNAINTKYNYSHNPFLANLLIGQSDFVPPTQSSTVQADYHLVTDKPVDVNLPLGHTFIPGGNYLKKYCLKVRGQFPGKYCNHFVNCWEGNAVEQFCAQPLLFNPVTCYCDYPYNVNCQGRPITAYPTYPSSTSNGSWIPDADTPIHPVYPVPPINPVFPINPLPPVNPASPANPLPPVNPVPPLNPVFVVNPELVTIRPTAPPPYFPTTGPILPPLQDSFVPLPVPVPIPNPSLKKYCLKPRGQFPGTSCNKYVNCWDDVVIEQECPHGLLFSNTKLYCDYPYNVVCTTNKPRNTLPLLMKDSSSYPTCLSANGTYKDDTDCSSYYICSNYQISKLRCSEGYKFNNVIGACDHEHKVDCNERIEFQYQPINNLIEKLPAAFLQATLNCEEGRVYRLNSQCSSVSICRKNVAEVVHCPTGLAYDIASNKCLKAELVKCM